MIKIIIIWIDQLETYLNKPWFSFLCNFQDKFIFKFQEKTSKQIVQLTKTQQFFNMFINKEIDLELIQQVLPENSPTDNELLKSEIVKFVNYWIEKNENGNKRRYEKQKTFEITSRLRTWFSNIKITTKKEVNPQELLITDEI